ncbi:MAG: hypothetical protein HN368_15510 [Spirochaetales bacterium]|nr:hypothetical protein [Spirochaetales bacterium]
MKRSVLILLLSVTAYAPVLQGQGIEGIQIKVLQNSRAFRSSDISRLRSDFEDDPAYVKFSTDDVLYKGLLDGENIRHQDYTKSSIIIKIRATGTDGRNTQLDESQIDSFIGKMIYWAIDPTDEEVDTYESSFTNSKLLGAGERSSLVNNGFFLIENEEIGDLGPGQHIVFAIKFNNTTNYYLAVKQIQRLSWLNLKTASLTFTNVTELAARLKNNELDNPFNFAYVIPVGTGIIDLVTIEALEGRLKIGLSLFGAFDVFGLADFSAKPENSLKYFMETLPLTFYFGALVNIEGKNLPFFIGVGANIQENWGTYYVHNILRWHKTRFLDYGVVIGVDAFEFIRNLRG